MNTNDCPKFISCSATICPLDPDWNLRSYLDGERVCRYLTEYSKPTAKPILKGVLAEEHYQAIELCYPKVTVAHPRIKRQLQRSSKNATRFEIQLELEV